MFRVNHAKPELKRLTTKGFVADMHFHTEYSHDCQTSVREVVSLAERLSIFVAITDHNVIGGVLAAQKLGSKRVIPGIELCTREGKELLIYFSTPRRLERFYEGRVAPSLQRRNALRSSRTLITMRQLITWLEREECLVALPHPFASLPRKSYPYFSTHEELLARVDAIEVFNQTMRRRANLAALGWAVELRKGIVGGSDGHALAWLGSGVTCSKATTIKEHLQFVKEGRVEVHGYEFGPVRRVMNFAQTTGKSKLRKGLRGGFQRLAGRGV